MPMLNLFGLSRTGRSRLSLTAAVSTALVAFGAGFFGATSAQAACSSSAGPGVDWTGCRKRALIVSGGDFSNAKLNRTDFTGSDLRDTNLTGTSMVKATLTRSSIAGAKLLNASLSGVEGIRLAADKAQFQSVDMTKSMFFRARFVQAVLNDVDFSKAEFSRSDFTGAVLQNTTMESSNLSRVIFLATQFSNVNLKDAWTYLTDFSGVDLTATTGLTQNQVNLACGDANTKLPAELETPSTWPCSGADN